MKFREILTCDLTKSKHFDPVARALNLLYALFFAWLGVEGIIHHHIRFKRYDHHRSDAQLFGIALCALGGAWVLYTAFGELFTRSASCRIIAGVLGVTFIVCTVVVICRNV
jgi:hypothetical protein